MTVTAIPPNEAPVYLVATATPPRVVCPPWCTVSEADHLADLRNQEGLCIHHSATNSRGWGISSVTTVDGQVWDADPKEPPVTLWTGGETLTLAEAEQEVAMITGLIKMARLELVKEARA